jgi:hypothetical protein
MTEQKATNTRKPSTRKAAPKKVAEPKVEATEAVEQKVETAKAKVKLAKDDKVEVMNNTTGRYGYIGRSGYSFELEDYGDIAEVPFGELQSMRSGSQKRHLEDAFIVVLDEDAIAELNYTKLYENVLDASGVEQILTDLERLEEVLPKMPLVMKETFITIAKRKFNEDDISLKVVRVIEKHLNMKFGI